jgi:hypothetical protein
MNRILVNQQIGMGPDDHATLDGLRYSDGEIVARAAECLWLLGHYRD